jgi:hypothetical protein
MSIQSRLHAPRTSVTWHSVPKESLCVPLLMNEQQANLLRLHYLGGRFGSQMPRLESLLEPNQRQQCSFFSDSSDLHHGQMCQSWIG